jgi:hypothetical protein
LTGNRDRAGAKCNERGQTTEIVFLHLLCTCCQRVCLQEARTAGALSGGLVAAGAAGAGSCLCIGQPQPPPTTVAALGRLMSVLRCGRAGRRAWAELLARGKQDRPWGRRPAYAAMLPKAAPPPALRALALRCCRLGRWARRADGAAGARRAGSDLDSMRGCCPAAAALLCESDRLQRLLCRQDRL